MTAAPVRVSGATPAGRVDARRNREVVLRTAVRMFAEDGLDVPLGRIARRAGVGAGTVYRHFPSKEILLEAVFAEHVGGLVTAADRWAARAAPGDALFGFLLEVIEAAAGRQSLCDTLAADQSWPRTQLAEPVRRYGEALDHLLAHAKRAGAVRTYIQTDDLTALVVGCIALRSAHPDRARGVRLVQLTLDGLRSPTVTEAALFRDRISPPRHGTADHAVEFCVECGARLRVRATGRPPRYCGATCRQRARRRRTAQ